MNCTSRVRLLSSSKLGIRSSIEAFISSKITADWQPCEELYRSISGAVSKEQFEDIIKGFVSRGAVEIDTAEIKELVFNDGLDIRDYTGINFNPDELREAPALPLNLKKEILYLYYYGGRMNYYKVLNLNAETGESFKRIQEHCSFYRMMTAGKHFEGLDLGSYKAKIEKVRGIIKNACQIEEIDLRKNYDMTLKTTERKADAVPAKNLSGSGRTAANSAEEHFVLAMKHYHDNDLKKALNEIVIATHLNPDCMDYFELKKEVTEKLKNERTDALFNAFENNDNLLLHEDKLEKVISGIVELTESSSLAHLRLAKIALEKDMPSMAIQHAKEAVRKDPDLAKEADLLISQAERKIKELNISPYDKNIFKINNPSDSKK